MSDSTTNRSKEPIRAADGRIVGWLKKDTLGKNVKASRHMLQKPRGWAWDVSILDEAERQGVTQTEIHDQETNRVYRAPLEAFRRHGVKLNRGFGLQICLPIMFWEISRLGQNMPKQLALL